MDSVFPGDTVVVCKVILLTACCNSAVIAADVCVPPQVVLAVYAMSGVRRLSAIVTWLRPFAVV